MRALNKRITLSPAQAMAMVVAIKTEEPNQESSRMLSYIIEAWTHDDSCLTRLSQ